MELKDTIERMLSDDYKERLIAEYQQLGIRIEKLREAIFQYSSDNKDWPSEKRALYQKQLDVMRQYQDVLTERILDEKIPGFGCFGDTCPV